MTIRTLFWLIFTIVLFVSETSFTASLPGIASVTPFVFAVIVYLVQHQGLFYAAWWLIPYGILLDLFHLGVLRVETIALSVAAIVVWFSAKRLFSNRSYYGVIACGLIGFLAVILVEAFLLPLEHLLSKEIVEWTSFWSISVARLVTLLVLMTVIYPFARRIRTIINTLFVISSR